MVYLGGLRLDELSRRRVFMYYGVEPIFWLKLLVILASFVLVVLLFNSLMRKLLKVKKRKSFSYNHINEKHKRIDRTIRIAFFIIIIIGFFINIFRGPDGEIWYLQPYLIIIIYLIISEIARAYMEWKYETNRNAWIFTISQLAFICFLLFSFITTNFFGLFR